MKINKKKLIVIVGPTASGKTRLSIEIAKKNNCPIISCDSRQFYREMTIGTAKPSQLELDSVQHFFIDNLSIHDPYSAGKYAEEVESFFSSYYKKKDILVMVGGSGLFIDAVLKGLDDFPHVPEEIREELNLDLKNKGLDYLTNLLEKVDINYYKNIDLNNPRRVIRGLEVYKASKKPYSSFIKKEKKYRKDIDIEFIGLNPQKETLYSHIELRVDLMIERGLLNEAKGLFEYKNLTPLKTVGYTELFKFLQLKTSLNQAINEIKINTKKYSKRQMTWFKKNERINWKENFEDFIN